MFKSRSFMFIATVYFFVDALEPVVIFCKLLQNAKLNFRTVKHMIRTRTRTVVADTHT